MTQDDANQDRLVETLRSVLQNHSRHVSEQVEVMTELAADLEKRTTTQAGDLSSRLGETQELIRMLTGLISDHTDLIGRSAYSGLLHDAMFAYVLAGVSAALYSPAGAFRRQVADMLIDEAVPQIREARNRIMAMSSAELNSGAVGDLMDRLFDALPALPKLPGGQS